MLLTQKRKRRKFVKKQRGRREEEEKILSSFIKIPVYPQTANKFYPNIIKSLVERYLVIQMA